MFAEPDLEWIEASAAWIAILLSRCSVSWGKVNQFRGNYLVSRGQDNITLEIKVVIVLVAFQGIGLDSEAPDNLWAETCPSEAFAAQFVTSLENRVASEAW